MLQGIRRIVVAGDLVVPPHDRPREVWMVRAAAGVHNGDARPRLTAGVRPGGGQIDVAQRPVQPRIGGLVALPDGRNELLRQLVPGSLRIRRRPVIVRATAVRIFVEAAPRQAILGPIGRIAVAAYGAINHTGTTGVPGRVAAVITP